MLSHGDHAKHIYADNMYTESKNQLFYWILQCNFFSTDTHAHMCSILTKGSTCRKNKKLRLILTNLLKKKISVLAQIFTKLWSIYELHNFIILIIILNIII